MTMSLQHKCLFLMVLRILIVSVGILAFLKSPDASTRDIENKKRVKNLIESARKSQNSFEILENSLAPDQLEETLENFLAYSRGYLKLYNVLTCYQTIAQNGGWPIVPNHPEVLHSGYKKPLKKSARRSLTRKKFIEILCERLIASNDLNIVYGTDHDEYEDTIKEAVRKFQQRHGLEVDGIVGHETLTAMNIPAEERIRQIELNLERYRYVHQNLGDRYILINIANYELKAVENNDTVLTMRVVVGKPERPTPVFSDTMTYLVLNPYWYVPNTIATEDLFPLVQRDSSILTKKNIKIIQGIGEKARELNPLKIMMSKANFLNYTFKFRQDPGPQNPLGRVKFILPNKFAVYIHDTPSRHIFLKSERTFSSGCIRIENPLDLAEFVLRGDPKWDRHRIALAIENGKRQKVLLPQPIPVHIVYLTAWADENGTVQFRKDVYQYDKSTCVTI